MGKIHIIASFIFVLYISLSMEINVYVDQDFRWMEVNGWESYELLSDVLPIGIELLLNAGTTIINLYIILACIITIGIDLFIEIPVMPVIYMIQLSSDVKQMIVQEITGLVYTC